MNPARPRWLTPLQVTDSVDGAVRMPNCHAIIPSRFRLSSLVAEYPSSCPSTSSVCWPNVGGAVRMRFSAPLYRTAGPTCQNDTEAITEQNSLAFIFFIRKLTWVQKRRHKLCLHRVPVPALRMWSQSRTLLVEAGDVHFSRFQKRNKKLSILDV